MGRTPAFSPEMAMEIKAKMFNGEPLKELALAYNTSYNTMVNIRAGMQYRDIPWPDSSLGPMSQIQNNALRDQRKFQSKVQGNAAYAGNGGAPQAMYSEERRMEAVLTDALNALGRKNGFIDYNSYIMHKRNIRMEEERKKADAEEAIRMKEYKKWFAKRYANGEDPVSAPRPELEQIDPDVQEMLEWDYVLAKGEKMSIVQTAEAEQNIGLQFAIRIILKQIAVRDWQYENVLQNILKAKKWIDNFWEAHPERMPVKQAEEPIEPS